MKKHGLAAAAVCIAVIGAMWMEWPEPAGDQVWAYQKLQPADYRLLHSDALGFVTAKAHEGFELHARHTGAMSFEIRCKGVLVMDVENAPSRVLIRMPADAHWRAPDIERLRLSFERWLDLHQSQGRLLVENAGPSWVEARLGRFYRPVSDDQRCVFKDPGRPWSEPSSWLRPPSGRLQAVERIAPPSSALLRTFPSSPRLWRAPSNGFLNEVVHVTGTPVFQGHCLIEQILFDQGQLLKPLASQAFPALARAPAMLIAGTATVLPLCSARSYTTNASSSVPARHFSAPLLSQAADSPAISNPSAWPTPLHTNTFIPSSRATVA